MLLIGSMLLCNSQDQELCQNVLMLSLWTLRNDLDDTAQSSVEASWRAVRPDSGVYPDSSQADVGSDIDLPAEVCLG